MVESLRPDLQQAALSVFACTMGDKVHFDTAAQNEIGKRFAARILEMIK